MIKNFIKERSKIHLFLVIASILLFFIGILPEFFNYSMWVKDLSLAYEHGIDPNLTQDQIHLALFAADFVSLMDITTILLTSFMFISIIFNTASYIYKKLEFLFISISFIILIILINIYSFEVMGCLVFILIIVLNILTYIEQLKINKTKIKN